MEELDFLGLEHVLVGEAAAAVFLLDAAHVEGEDGGVPDIWLLSARASFKIPNTKATVFVHGENLTDELYIVDRSRGVLPGAPRMLQAGVSLKY